LLSTIELESKYYSKITTVNDLLNIPVTNAKTGCNNHWTAFFYLPIKGPTLLTRERKTKMTTVSSFSTMVGLHCQVRFRHRKAATNTAGEKNVYMLDLKEPV
jgi:hypothetical protein